MTNTDHETMMRQALALGETADREGDMGVGAVIVRDGRIGHWVLGGRLKAVGRRYGDYSVETSLKFVDADIEVTTGILPEECQALRNRYFARK